MPNKEDNQPMQRNDKAGPLGFPVEALISALDIGIKNLKAVQPDELQEKSDTRDMEVLREGFKSEIPTISTSRGKYSPLEFLTSVRGDYIASKALFYALRTQTFSPGIRPWDLQSKHRDAWIAMRTDIFKFSQEHFEDYVDNWLPTAQARVAAIRGDGQNRHVQIKNKGESKWQNR